MHIQKLISGAIFSVLVLVGHNARAQFPLPPPPTAQPPSPPTRDIEAEVTGMTKRYGLSEDEAAKVRTILKEQTKKSEDTFKDESLTFEERIKRLKSQRDEEISRVSDVLTPEQKKKYQADVNPPQRPPSSSAEEHPSSPTKN